MAAAASSADAGDVPASSPPMTAQQHIAATSTASTADNYLPGQYLESDDDADDSGSQQFWDVLTTADRSPSASPPPLGARATGPSASRTSRHLRDASFTTAVEFGASFSRDQVPRLESRTPTPVGARLQAERQRWLLSQSRGGETSSVNTTTSNEAQPFNSSPPIGSEPIAKHDAASDNSHDLATDNAPPPTLLNARPRSRDTARRSLLQRGLQPLKRLTSRGDRSVQGPGTTDSVDSADALEGRTREDLATPSPDLQDLNISMDGRPRSARRQVHNNDGQTPLRNGFMTADDQQSQELGESGTEGQSSEDMFLSLARETPLMKVAPDHDGQDRKRSRPKRSGPRQSLPASQLSRADSSDHESAYGPPSAFENNQRMYGRRSSQVASTGLGGYREASPVSTASRLEGLGRLEQYRQRYIPSQRAQSVINGPTSPDITSHSRRRPSLTGELPSPGYKGQAYKPSRLTNHLQGLDSSSVIEIPPQSSRPRGASMTNAEGNDSVISGPSAVWDELEELKSRIKRMERGGVAASASGAAVQSSASGSNERPRTATTTVTTISSSPKHNRNPRKALSPTLSSANEDGDATPSVYPLLHQALARCKTVLSPSTYRVLEAMANDAIEMVTLTSGGGSQAPAYSAASVIGGAAVADRQIRRKADNMCRTVTELCIALCEQNSALNRSGGANNSPTIVQSIEQRPSSKRGQPTSPEAQEESPASGAYARHALRSASLEPDSANAELRSTPSRALSRIEARRNSLNVTGLSSSAANSPREPRVSEVDEPPNDAAPTPLQRISSIPSRFTRAGTSLLRSRRRVAEDEREDDSPMRPVSRAMTDIGGAGAQRDPQLRVPSLRDRANHRLSREYTSNEPLPEHTTAPQPSQRRVTGSLLRQGDGGSRRYPDRAAPPVAYESADRTRVASSAGLYGAGRRTSGVSLAAGRKTRGTGLAVDTGPSEG